MSNLVEVKVPDIGDFAEVPIIDLFVKVGDSIKVDDAICTLESDKATMDVPSPVAGVVKEVLVQLGAKVGGYITVKDEQFLVVGLADKTLTAPDSAVWMSLADAQRLFLSDLPEMVSAQLDAADLVTSFTVYPTPDTDPEELATRINGAVDGVQANGPSYFKDQIASATQIFNAILYGIAIIALFVGGLSVINTMTMSVNERTREIGVRKAIGASDGQIVRQFLAEAGIIGLIGGVSGLFLGWVASLVANRLLEGRNLNLFLVSPRLAIGSVAFAIVLGLVSGLYPALHAARLQPVVALPPDGIFDEGAVGDSQVVRAVIKIADSRGVVDALRLYARIVSLPQIDERPAGRPLERDRIVSARVPQAHPKRLEGIKRIDVVRCAIGVVASIEVLDRRDIVHHRRPVVHLGRCHRFGIDPFVGGGIVVRHDRIQTRIGIGGEKRPFVLADSVFAGMFQPQRMPDFVNQRFVTVPSDRKIAVHRIERRAHPDISRTRPKRIGKPRIAPCAAVIDLG